MTVHQKITAKRTEGKLQRAYRDTFEELGDEARRDWRVLLLAWFAMKLFANGRAYRYVLRGVMAEVVLKDLKRFCFATRSTIGVSTSVKSMLWMEGRRHVWLRLQYFLRIDEPQVWENSEFTPEDF